MADAPGKPLFDMDLSKLMTSMKVPGMDVEALMATQRKNIEALTQANKVAYEGLQAVMTRQLEIFRETMDGAMSVGKEIIDQKDPKAAMQKQSELAKAAFEKALTNMKDVADMMAKSNTEATNLITKRVSETMAELRELMMPKAS